MAQLFLCMAMPEGFADSIQRLVRSELEFEGALRANPMAENLTRLSRFGATE
jgi:hypothetical protein